MIFKLNKLQFSLSYLTQCMEDDIQNYLPSVMFRGTPAVGPVGKT